MPPPREQCYPEALLQGIQVVRHGRLRHPQLPPGCRERAVLQDGEKDTQAVDAEARRRGSCVGGWHPYRCRAESSPRTKTAP